MAHVANLSFLDNIKALSNSEMDTQLENERKHFDLMCEFPKRLTFPIAPTLNPGGFCDAIRSYTSNGATNSPMDFSKGTTTLGFVFKGGVIIAVDARASMGTYISSSTVKKVIEINDYLLGTMAGGAADCAFWERHLARLCRLHELKNGERISVAGAAQLLANIFFHYRGYGLSCGTMIAGQDRHGPSLYFVSDDGTRVKGNLFSCGSGSTYAYGILDTNYNFNMSVKDAIDLGERAIYHATHRDGGSGGNLRVYHVHKDGWTAVIPEKDVGFLYYEKTKNLPE